MSICSYCCPNFRAKNCFLVLRLKFSGPLRLGPELDNLCIDNRGVDMRFSTGNPKPTGDRQIHHGRAIVIQGNRYRMKGKNLD